jgi:hypothetical protein
MPQRLRYPSSRYAPDIADLYARRARRLSAPGLKAFGSWRGGRCATRTRALLGGVTHGPFYEMKRESDRGLEPDRLTRISSSSASSKR